jgi:hypothetical protein
MKSETICLSFLFVALICGIAFFSAHAENSVIKVTSIDIVQPKDGNEIQRKPVKVKGKIEYTGDFDSRYSLWLYKSVGGGFYWQEAGVILSGKQWSGKVWPQERGFSPEDIKSCEKLEEVIAVIYKKNELSKLPGYNNPGRKVTMEELNGFLPKDIGLTISLPVEYINKYPCKH